jgi:uncharacterized protein (DUF3084 family)
MNISSVLSSSNNVYSSTNNNDGVEQLEKQKANLETELQKISQSKDDEKTKQQKIKQLQMQIQQIEAQIQQKQAVKANKSSGVMQEMLTYKNDVNKVSEEDLYNSTDSVKGNNIDVLV